MMKTTKEVLHDIFCLPFIFFERPAWDKFPGAKRTFAADVINPDGRMVQQPSTHLLNLDFSEGFNVKFKDKDEKEKFCYITCYGPATSRIFASVIIVHGDNKGLVFPWKIAPVQVIITPIFAEDKLIKKSEEIKAELEKAGISAEIDKTERNPGEKFYYWEMKGVPMRIEVGKREIEAKEFPVFRRDSQTKEKVKENNLVSYIEKTSKDYEKSMISRADNIFKSKITDVSSFNELKKAIEGGKVARAEFCSVDKDGEKCAEKIEKELARTKVRGTKLEKEKPSGKTAKCLICGKKAKEVVYIAQEY